jgi:hypothetical protein
MTAGIPTSPGLYVGTVTHRRIKPRAHRLRYRVYWMLLDLDDVERLDKTLRLFSLERFNLFSFRSSDHGNGSRQPLRPQIEAHLKDGGIDLDGGAIRLLCMPRILGYGFNPISVYYCYRRGGALAAIVYEVHNTFGERHSYLISVDPAHTGGALQQNCTKAFYVSPFMDMDLAYDFRLTEPEERVALTVQASDPAGPVIVASMMGKRRPLTDAALLRVFFTHPLLTLKVIAGIHWEALRLWWKGMKLRTRPPAPGAVTIVNGDGTSHV